MHSDTKLAMLSSRLLSLNKGMFKMKINSVAAQVISIIRFNAPYYRQIFFMEPYSDRLVFLVIRYLASEPHQTTLTTINDVLVPLDTPLCPLQFYLRLQNKNYQRVEFELIQQIQSCVLSSVNAFTISYGYHIKVILSPKLLHCKTMPGVQHL